MRVRSLILAALAGSTLLVGFAAPASAQCNPQLIDTGDPCPNACDDEAEAWNNLNRRLGGAIGEYPFLCTM